MPPSSATVSVGSVDHDARLRSFDHLDVDRHPTAEFRSTDVDWVGDRARVSGLLTVVGATDHVELDVRYRGTVTDPWGRQRSGFSASTTIARRSLPVVRSPSRMATASGARCRLPQENSATATG